MASSIFYYVTYKYVLLKDARLGLLYYALAIIIALFTVGELFLKRGYMEVRMINKGWLDALVYGNWQLCAH